ncbi:MAG TPA: rod shape-determining protein MreB [Clostridia bacterium]|nr:rod shape-determining protein MreB [Clostridia bacterium]
MFGNRDIGIDLGTSRVLIYMRGKGVILSEPSVVAIDTNGGKILAVGSEASRMLGRTPGNIVAIRPLQDGVISDYELTERMLRYFFGRAMVRRFGRKPRVVVCVPSGVTEVEKRAVIDASYEAGARRTYLIEEPIAAAIGAGVDISKPYGNMVVDIGGGTTDIAVISLGGAVVTESIKTAGDMFDEYIIRYMRKRYNLLIGGRTAEKMKIEIGSAIPRKEKTNLDVTGRNLISGLPKTINVSSDEMVDALEEVLEGIVETIHSVLEKTPPELSSDISENGIIMTGGGSLLYGLDKLLEERLKIGVNLAEDAISCVAIGTGKALENIDIYAETFMFDYRRGQPIRESR